MAVKQSATITGLADRTVRLGKPVLMNTFENVAADQALVYESITGLKVPTASAIVATPHVHDDTDGKPLPIPLAGGVTNAVISKMDSESSTTGYQPLIYSPFYVPAGVTKVTWVGFSSAKSIAPTLRAICQSSTIADIGEPQDVFYEMESGDAGPFVMSCELDVNAGALNLLKITCLDSFYDVPDSRDLSSWFVVPSIALGAIAVPPWEAPNLASTRVRVPGATQHLGAHAYTSMDAAHFTAKRSLNAWMLQGMALNDALLSELATGRPAGGNADGHTNDSRYAGHSHAGGSTLADCGALIDQPLCSISYGVARDWSTLSGQATADMADTSERSWHGRIHAPTLLAGVAGTYYKTGEHLFRLPALDELHARDSVPPASSTKLKGCALVRMDTSKLTTANVRLTLTDPTGTDADGSAVVQTITTNGMRVLTFDDLDATRDPGDTGVLQRLVVEMSQGTAQSAGISIYGVCAWQET